MFITNYCRAESISDGHGLKRKALCHKHDLEQNSLLEKHDPKLKVLQDVKLTKWTDGNFIDWLM